MFVVVFKRMLVGKWTVYYVEEGYTQTILGSEWCYDADGNFTNIQGDWHSEGIYHWDGKELIMTIDNQPWSAVVKDITSAEMIWLGPNTGKIIKLKRQQ